MINFGTVSTNQELYEILQLQKSNLPAHISQKEADAQGFVTVQHDFDLLKKMNHPHPHVIAKAAGKVIGYALVMLRKWQKEIPVLVPMFEQINSIKYEYTLLENASYLIMGQICIAKNYRGKGIFPGLYQEMKKQMKCHFDYVITEVSTRNERSIRAHTKVGFEKIKTYTTKDGESWEILLWKISK